MGVANIFVGTKTEQQTKNARLAICKECPYVMRAESATIQCRKCGCFLRVKTGIVEEECPVGKW